MDKDGFDFDDDQIRRIMEGSVGQESDFFLNSFFEFASVVVLKMVMEREGEQFKNFLYNNWQKIMKKWIDFNVTRHTNITESLEKSDVVDKFVSEVLGDAKIPDGEEIRLEMMKRFKKADKAIRKILDFEE